jgi:predicted lipid-binding transport protein (Tim44 family)
MPDSQTLGLFIAAMIAGVVCFRLYTVLGRRNGQEAPANPVFAPAAPAPEAVTVRGGSGLLDIQLADKSFDTTAFLKGARDAYALIVTAFARGDREALRPLLSPDVMAAFDAGIAGRGDAVAPAFVRLTDAKIVAASLHGAQAEITIAFTADFSTGPVTDVWSFAREVGASDPNWRLVATSGDLPE